MHLDTLIHKIPPRMAHLRIIWDKERIVDEIVDNLWMFSVCFGESLWITCVLNFPAGSRYNNIIRIKD